MKTVVTVFAVSQMAVFGLLAWMIVRRFYDDWREWRACRALGREVDRMARGR